MQLAAIAFLNALPLTYGLPWPVRTLRPAEFTSAAVADCDLILAPVIFGFKHPAWQIVDDTPAIGCDGTVGSVRIDFAPGQTLATARSIARSVDSQTANQLLAVLLRMAWQRADIELVPADAAADARLIIGDQALATPAASDSIDLGASWKQWTGLPFVFATWMSRTPLEPALRAQLRETKTRNLANLWPIFSRVTTEMPTLKYHFTQQLVYDCGPAQRSGLAQFLAHCQQQGLA